MEDKKPKQIGKDENEGKFEKYLLNKTNVDYMHNRYLKKFQYLKELSNLLQSYHDAFLDFVKRLSNIKDKFIEIDNPQKKTNNTKEKASAQNQPNKSYNSINQAIEELFTLITKQTVTYNFLAKKIITSNNLPKEPKFWNLDQREKQLHNNSKNLLKEYKNYKTNFLKCKSDYETNFDSLEKMYIDEKQDKNKENKINKTIDNLNKIIEKYKNSEQLVNQKENEIIQNDKELYKLYEKFDLDIYNSITNIIGTIKDQIKYVNDENIKYLSLLEIKYRDINKENDIDEYINVCIEDNKNEVFEVKKVKYEPYTPKTELSNNYLTGNEKEINAFKKNYLVLYKLKQNFNDICPNLDFEKEKQKVNFLSSMQKIFYPEPNIKLKDKEKDNLLSLLSEKDNRKLFIVFLSNQRTKGRYQRGKELIKDLGIILEHILNISEKEKSFEEAKHCIIISQTFYYEEKNSGKKIYLFEYIKINKWLTSLEFWEEMTKYMINKEIENNNKVLGEEALKKESDNTRRERISQVYLSQLLTFSENMIDFGFDKKEIFKILDINAKIYNVLESFKTPIKENVNTIFRTKPTLAREEISQFYKIRQKTLKITRKKIIINNHKFNDKKENDNDFINQKIKRRKSSILLFKVKKAEEKEKNQKFEKIKKEINNINDLIIKSKTKSENVIKNKRYAYNQTLMFGQNILNNIINLEKKEKNEIIIEDKKEEKIEDKKEDKKEEQKKEGIDKEPQKEIIKDEPKKEEDEKDNENKKEGKKEEQKKEGIEKESQKEMLKDEPKKEDDEDKNKNVEIKKGEDSKEIEVKKEVTLNEESKNEIKDSE